MPPTAIKTIRDLIFWEYAKLISQSAGKGRDNFAFVMFKFKELQSRAISWSTILREDLKTSRDECAYCGAKSNLSHDHIVPKRECHYDEIHNIVAACKSCNSSKGDKDLIEWYGLDRRAEIPRIVMGKYLKMLYICHECRGTLAKRDINKDGKVDLLDLGWIFKETCGEKGSALK
ncbi:MAG: HNH endonuclease [candidate division FCPU426 bacterium]